jgi:hypothetical protein
MWTKHNREQSIPFRGAFARAVFLSTRNYAALQTLPSAQEQKQPSSIGRLAGRPPRLGIIGSECDPCVRTRKYEVVSCSVAIPNNSFPFRTDYRRGPLLFASRLQRFQPVPSETPCSRKPGRPTQRPTLTVGQTHQDCSHRSNHAIERLGTKVTPYRSLRGHLGHLTALTLSRWFE